MGLRRTGRENALRALYFIDITGYGVEEVLKIIFNNEDMPKESLSFAETLVRGTIENKNEIDKLISEYSQNWSIERMPTVDRNILRLATYEFLKMQETPVKVIINEAVEIAKIYSTSESGKFVNGVLDKIKVIREKNLY